MNPLRSCPLQIESTDHFFLRCQNHILLRTTPLMKKLSSFNSERVSLRQTALIEVIPYGNKKLKGIFTWDRKWNIPEMKFCFAMKKFQFTLLFIAAEIKCNFFSGVVWSSNVDEVIRLVCLFVCFYDKISQVQKSIKKSTRHEKALKSTKNTTNLRFINLKFIDIRFINLKFIDIRFIKLKKHLSGKK